MEVPLTNLEFRLLLELVTILRALSRRPSLAAQVGTTVHWIARSMWQIARLRASCDRPTLSIGRYCAREGLCGSARGESQRR